MQRQERMSPFSLQQNVFKFKQRKWPPNAMQIERNSYKQVSNTTNTKEGTDGQT